MAPPLTLDGSAKSGAAGRDLLRLKISADNTDGVVYVQTANAGRAGLYVYDETHAQTGFVTGYAFKADDAGGLYLGGVRCVWDDGGYLRLAHGPGGTNPLISLGHSGGDTGAYYDASFHAFRSLSGAAAGAVVVISTDPGSSDTLRVTGAVGISTSGTFVGTNRKALNLRGNRSAGGQITFEDANASPGASWEVGIGAGTAANEFNWYNQTATAVRMSLKPDGSLTIPGAFRAGDSHWVQRRDTAADVWAIYSQAGSFQIYDHVNARDVFTISPGGSVQIGAFNDNHLILLSSNSGYGWRIDTNDLGSGNVPLRIYKRTASVDTLVFTIRNATGYVELISSGKLFFGTAAADYALRAKAGSPVALECVAGDESAYADFRARTLYATAGGSFVGNTVLVQFDNGSKSANFTIDWNNGNNQRVTLAAAGPLVITFSNGQAGGVYTLQVVQDATGSRTVTWPATVIWAGGATPTLTTTASRADIFTFFYDAVPATDKYCGSTFGLNFAV